MCSPKTARPLCCLNASHPQYEGGYTFIDPPRRRRKATPDKQGFYQLCVWMGVIGSIAGYICSVSLPHMLHPWMH